VAVREVAAALTQYSAEEAEDVALTPDQRPEESAQTATFFLLSSKTSSLPIDTVHTDPQPYGEGKELFTYASH